MKTEITIAHIIGTHDSVMSWKNILRRSDPNTLRTAISRAFKEAVERDRLTQLTQEIKRIKTFTGNCYLISTPGRDGLPPVKNLKDEEINNGYAGPDVDSEYRLCPANTAF